MLGFIPGAYNGTFTPEISFRDALGLDGMSFDDRTRFLASAQKIIDNVLPGLNVDARSFTYSTAYLSNEDFENGKRSLTFSGNPVGLVNATFIGIIRADRISTGNFDPTILSVGNAANFSGDFNKILILD